MAILAPRFWLPARVLGCAALLMLAGLLATACGGGDDEAPEAGAVSGTLDLGERVELASATIPSSGGTIRADGSDDSLDGLELTLPPRSYRDEREFTVSYRPVSGHSYDDRINPISPLITVENGGDYADQVMALKVPVEVPEGHFAMGFFYDEATGELEGMPLLAVEEGSVTVGTRHFSDVIISSISESVLRTIVVDSGFRPGVDDWQYANYGSYIEPDGHCAGQSISAMWYYYERRLQGEEGLYGLYDNYLSDEEKTPDLWRDDNLAYRLASTVQHDINWKALGFKLFESLESVNDTLQMFAFAYALHVTHAPQFVGLTDTVNGGGHAIIAYKIEGGSLWVADPNYPGIKSAEGKIEYVDGAFQPYRSALSASSDPTSFDKIGYYAVSAMIDWDSVGARFGEMESGAVGDEYFPPYALRALSVTELTAVPLVDGVAFPDNQLRVLEPGQDWVTDVYRDGQKLAKDGGFVTLEPGENRLGIEVWRATGTDDQGNDVFGYVDFYRVNVIYNQVTIEPNPVAGNAGDDLEMTATMAGQVEGERYEWSYGDGTPTENLSLRAMHVWDDPGDYPVTLMVYDKDDRLVGVGETTAQIGSSGSASPTASGAGTGSGGWVLKNVEPYQHSPEEAADWCYNSFEVTIAGLSATTYGKCSWPSPFVDVWNQTQHSWSAAPPDRLAPGEVLQITSTTSTEGTFLTNGLSGGGSTWVRIDLVPGGGPYPGTGWASVTEENTPASAVSEFTIPSGSEGGLMLVALTFEGPGGDGKTTYTYEWQGP